MIKDNITYWTWLRMWPMLSKVTSFGCCLAMWIPWLFPDFSPDHYFVPCFPCFPDPVGTLYVLCRLFCLWGGAESSPNIGPFVCTLVLTSGFDLWFWPLVLTSGFDLWFWPLVLTSGYDLWFWPLVLTSGFDLWLWPLVLTSGFDLWLWPLVLTSGFDLWLWPLVLTSGYDLWFWPLVLTTNSGSFWPRFWQDSDSYPHFLMNIKI